MDNYKPYIPRYVSRTATYLLLAAVPIFISACASPRVSDSPTKPKHDSMTDWGSWGEEGKLLELQQIEIRRLMEPDPSELYRRDVRTTDGRTKVH